MATKSGFSAPLRHTVMRTPVGNLTVFASTRGIAKIAFEDDFGLTALEEATISRSSSRNDDDFDEATALLVQATKQLREYFTGKRSHFALPLDLLPTFPVAQSLERNSSDSERNTSDLAVISNPWVSPNGHFRVRAQLALLLVPYAQTATYKEVAGLVGAPNASRAVGTACATNPLPIILPCHRIVRSDGELGRYAGGAEKKEFLLGMERNYAARH